MFLNCSINKYFQYLNGQTNPKDRLDSYYKAQMTNANYFSGNARHEKYSIIAHQIRQDATAMQRACSILTQTYRRTSINRTTIQNVAKQINPQRSFPVAKAMERARQAYREIRPYHGFDYARQEFFYDKKEKKSDEKVNPLENDIIEKGTVNKPKNELYSIDDSQIKMSGILNIGKRNGSYKPRQEDSILLLSHPQNPDFKIAIVADGVGGGGDGDKASYLAVLRTMEWFKRLPTEFYTNNNIQGRRGNVNFYQSLINLVGNISDEMNMTLGGKPRKYIFCSNNKKSKWQAKSICNFNW